MRLVHLLFLVVGLVLPLEAYRLNVPRVLLPYHPTVSVSFELQVTHPTGGCFNWRSTRPDLVTVRVIDETGAGCSDRAEIRSVAKVGSIGLNELSAVIFAEDTVSGMTLSCGVTVDEIANINIETTTKILFVDAAPARMSVHAFNKEGDRFSTLSEISLDWELSSQTGAEKPLRIVPFEQSAYNAPPEIVSLEKNKKKGYVVLIEGVSTGSAHLTAKFNDPYLQKISAHSVDLAVVANLLLIPSQDVYVPLNSIVPFKVLIVKQHGTEVVKMPSTKYYLKSDVEKVAPIDKESSAVSAKSKGSTAIHLLTYNVDVGAKAGIRPPSTAIHVTDPESVQWHVSGDNWLLQTGRTYTVNIELLDEHGNTMYIADNALFKTEFDRSLFDVQLSANGSWATIVPLSPAKTSLKTKFVSVLDNNGKEVPQSGRVHGEQQVTIVDPLSILPSPIYLPFVDRQRSSVGLKVTGGSGLFDWRTGDRQIAIVDGQSGQLTASNIGETKVTVVDKRNSLLTATAQVHVVDLTGIGFGKTARETFVNGKLILNVNAFALDEQGNTVEVSDCRNVPFGVQVQDSHVLAYEKGKALQPVIQGTGCAAIELIGKTSADTKVTITYGVYRATIEVSVYENLHLETDELAVGVGSKAPLKIEGGPRHWIIDYSNYYRTVSNAQGSNFDFNEDGVVVTCSDKETYHELKVTVGNRPSTSLPFPVSSQATFTLCCARPTRLQIATADAHPTKCPANVHAQLAGTKKNLVLRGEGSCNGQIRQLKSIGASKTKWSSAATNIVKVSNSGIENDQVWAEVTSLTPGEATITAVAASLTASHTILVCDKQRIEPPTLVLWNEPAARGTVHLKGGSGHFYAEPVNGAKPDELPVEFMVKEGRLNLTPKKLGKTMLRVIDACLNEEEAIAEVRVTEIHSLAVVAPQFVEIGSQVDVQVIAQDEFGKSFDKTRLSNAKLETNNQLAVLQTLAGTHYRLSAEKVGVVSLTATARSSSGRLLTSSPHSLQIFSPIHLQPTTLTLIPESTFQLEVVGGPKPVPPLTFEMNNTKIASIEPNALITSKDLGYTSIVGSVEVSNGHVTKSTVVLRVVSLHGITLSTSARRVEAGGRVHLRLRGIVKNGHDEEPFAFGGAVYPFKVTWSVSDPAIIQPTHPFGEAVAEVDHNKFALWLSALRAGQVVVKVKVELHEHAKHHFSGSTRQFEAQTTIDVEDGFQLTEPQLTTTALRIAPSSNLQLKSIWQNPSFLVTNFANLVSVSPSGLLKTGGREGNAAVTIVNNDSSDKEAVFVPVTISRVYSLDVETINELTGPEGSRQLNHLPVGSQLELRVIARDSKGRRLHATGNMLRYRPHRFDLTDIVASDNNSTLRITLKSTGDTVLKIYDEADDQLTTFVRLSAAEQVIPAGILANRLLVNDVICLHPLVESHSENAHWSSKSVDTGRADVLDKKLGLLRLVNDGNTYVNYHFEEQSLHTKINIGEPQQLEIIDWPEFVSNDDHLYFFTIVATSNETQTKKTAVFGDCSRDQKAVISEVRPPFRCTASFVKKTKRISAVNYLMVQAVFDQEKGEFGCQITALDPLTAASALPVLSEELDKAPIDLELTAQWADRNYQVKEATSVLPFFFSLRVLESEMLLSTIDDEGSILSVWSPTYERSNIVARGCDGDIITVTKLTHQTPTATANVFFRVRVNAKPTALFAEHAGRCHLTVENKKTGRSVKVPVRIRLVDQATKHVFSALESRGVIDLTLVILQKYSHVIPVMLFTCVAAILILIAVLYLRRSLWEKSGAFVDTTTNTTMMNSNASFQSTLNSQANNSASYSSFSPVFKSTPNTNGGLVTSPLASLRGRNPGSAGDLRDWSTGSFSYK